MQADHLIKKHMPQYLRHKFYLLCLVYAVDHLLNKIVSVIVTAFKEIIACLEKITHGKNSHLTLDLQWLYNQ